MRILLLGGTGAMGVHLASLLAERGEEIFVTTRSKRKSNHDSIHYIQGNAHELNFLNGLLKNQTWDAIVDFMVYNTIELQARASILLQATRQYVFISSARVYADPESGLITENTPRLLDVVKDKEYLATDEYALTKARQENILMSSGFNNWTIVRPYITFSEQRLQLGVLEKEDWLYRVIHGRSIVFSEDIASKYTTMTYGLDVAYGIAGLLGKNEALGEAYHITASDCYTWNQILNIYMDAIEKATGIRPKVVFTKRAINLKFKRLQYQVKYCRLFNRRFDNSKILSVVPDLFFTDVRQSLQACCLDLIKTSNFQEISSFSHALMDKASGEFTSMNEWRGLEKKIKYWGLRLSPTKIIEYKFNK